MVDNSMISEEELFRVVGPGWKTYEIQKRKKTFREKLKGKPVFSMILQIMILQDFISGI